MRGEWGSARYLNGFLRDLKALEGAEVFPSNETPLALANELGGMMQVHCPQRNGGGPECNNTWPPESEIRQYAASEKVGDDISYAGNYSCPASPVVPRTTWEPDDHTRARKNENGNV